MPDLEPLFDDGDEPREMRGLRTKLAALPRGHSLAFGASCCERILPCYQVCSLSEQRGDFPTLRRHLDAIWELVSRESSEPGSMASGREDFLLLEDFKRSYPRAIPRVCRPDGCYDWEFDHCLASQAEYAVGAVMALEQGYVEAREGDYAAVAADAALLSIREFLVSMNDPTPPWGLDAMRMAMDDLDELMPPWGWEEDHEATMFLELIEELPLMVQEREKQDGDLVLLMAREELDRVFLDEFRENSSQGGIQPFRRGLFMKKPAS